MNVVLLKTSLVKHEALRLKPYEDTAGKLTIGVGRNLTDRGIRTDEAVLMLENDIKDAVAFCQHEVPDFFTLSNLRQNVLIEMVFNMGGPTFLQFKQLLSALAAGNLDAVPAHMLDSAWARQVGQRATDLATQWKSG